MGRNSVKVSGMFIAVLVVLSIFASPAIGRDHFIRLSEDLSIYSGDVITLRANDGTFVKRFYNLKGHSALMCYMKTPGGPSDFTVEVIGPGKIRLIANDGTYCRRFNNWKNMSIITMDKSVPDETSVFDVTPKGGNKITLRANNGHFLKRYYGYKKKSVITAYRSVEDPPSIFRVNRVKQAGMRCTEVVERVDFDLTKLQKNVKPYVIAKQNLDNYSPVEQTMQFKVSETVETEKVFTWGNSFQIGAETSFSTGIPLLGGADTTITVTAEFTKGGSKSSKDSQTFEATFPIISPPNTKLLATASIQKGIVDVPYTATISRCVEDGVGKEYKYTYKVRGIFRGVNAFALTNSIKKVR